MRRAWIFNRFVITFGGFAVLVVVWNIYISFNNDGRISGAVIGPDGAPVAGATVTLSERTLLVARPLGSVTTDSAGRFTFTDHDLHRLYLEAEKNDVGRAGPREFRLYFKGQNMTLDAPLQLVPARPS